jgi:charged multivesicular body protein 5
MKRVFGKKKADGPPAPTLDQASSSVGGRVESMDGKAIYKYKSGQRIHHFNFLISILVLFVLAKIASLEKELKGYKDKLKTTKSPAAKKQLQKRAMEVLKRKRLYEGQRDQLAGQQFNIDQAAFGVESAKASVSTVKAMQAASKELRHTIRKELNVDAVEDMTDDMAELFEDFDEINEALGRNFATPDDIDEADLEAELDMLEDEFEEEQELAEETPSYLQEPALPSLPTGVVGRNSSAAKVDEHGLPMITPNI